MRTAALVLLAGVAAAQAAPRPPNDRTPETIDYTKPERYARIPERDGDAALVKKLAAPLKAPDARRTFVNIHAFLAGVPRVPERGWDPDHRDFDQLVRGFDHRNCAAHALVFANLARACGIPAVYVKSSRHDWIRGFVATGETGSFAGHVWLEVFVDGKWRLVDAQGMRIFDDYDPADPELPGGLLAYEKGWDHFAMVHSTRRDAFKAEAQERWKGFDVSQLSENKAPGRSLLPATFVIAHWGEWREIYDHVRYETSFGRAEWPERKAKVRGNLLVVTSIAGETALPEADADAWLPVSLAQLAKDARAGKSLVRTRRLDDGTLVVLLSAPGWNDLMGLFWTTNFARIQADFLQGK
jgi:hypothetical protein